MTRLLAARRKKIELPDHGLPNSWLSDAETYLFWLPACVLAALLLLALAGCEDKAYPLDCYPRCIERLD